MDHREPVEVYRATDNIDAQMVVVALDEAGIKAMVVGDKLQGVVGEVPLGWATAPKIIVSAADAEQAKEIVRQFQTEHLAGSTPDDVESDDPIDD